MESMDEIPEDPFIDSRIKDFSRKKLNAIQRMWISGAILNGTSTAVEMAKIYSLNQSTVRKWVSLMRNGYVFQDSVGRPLSLDSESEEYLHDVLIEGRKNQNCVTKREFRALLNEEHKKTRKRRSQGDNVQPLSDRTDRYFRKKMDILTQQGQRKTSARIKAEFDPRNSYTEAVMFEAFQKGIDPHLIINFDATQYFSVNGDRTPEMVVFYKVPDDTSPITKEGPDNDDMGIFLKSYTLGSASGCMGPMVLLFADETLSETGLKVLPHFGVTHLADPTTLGYICFTKTRRGNKEFYDWYLETVICPYITKIRDCCNLGNMMAFVSSDGEQLQIETFASEKNVALLNEARIFEAKHSASYSAKGNAWDAGNYFKATKKSVKHIDDKELRVTGDFLLNSLDKKLAIECSHMTTTNRDKISNAVSRIVIACQKTCNPQIIQNGFKATGQYTVEKKGLDFDIKMSCCTRNLTIPEIENMKRYFPAMVRSFKEKGYLTENEMDDCDIVRVEDGRSKSKDERVMHQNRALIVNTDANLERFRKSSNAMAIITKNRQDKKIEKLALKKSKMQGK